MKINGVDYSITDLFKLAQAGRKWNKKTIYKKTDKEAVCHQWLEDNDIKSGPFKNKARNIFNNYVDYCNKNNIEESCRLTIIRLGEILGTQFTWKNHGGVRLFELNKDLSQNEKEIKDKILEKT